METKLARSHFCRFYDHNLLDSESIQCGFFKDVGSQAGQMNCGLPHGTLQSLSEAFVGIQGEKKCTFELLGAGK